MAFQDFDIIQNRKQEERKQKIRRRITIAVVSSIAVVLLAAVAVCGVMYEHELELKSKQNNAPHMPLKQNAANTVKNVVKVVCSGTDYAETCEKSLNNEIKANSSIQPKDILKATFSVVSDEIDNAIKQAKGLKFDTPMDKAAFDDCLELLTTAKEELGSCISSIQEHGTISSRTDDINNWLSAVLTYQETCIDGFKKGTPEKDSLKKLLKDAKELGSNALAIVEQVPSMVSMLKVGESKRNLLQFGDEYPSWIEDEHKRILKGEPAKTFRPNVTVAKDGSGNFSTINDALNAIPEKYKGRYVIYVKIGVYEENVIVTKDMKNVTIYGEGSQKSIITGSKNYVDGVPTFQTDTFAAIGDGFIAHSIGFRNTAGPEKHQAVALRVQSDRSIFLNCRMEGYQDTLYAQTHRQFYRSCYITGTVDFIFGNAASVFQNCMIYVRKPMENQQNIVTAQGRIERRQTTGIVLQNCHILADDKLQPEKKKFKSYLGRPWKEYSRTIIMETEIGDLIHPEGWMKWDGDFALKTLHYAEFNNKGPGAAVVGRVKWTGYKGLITKDEARKYSIGPFLQAGTWLENSDVPARFGMFT